MLRHLQGSVLLPKNGILSRALLGNAGTELEHL